MTVQEDALVCAKAIHEIVPAAVSKTLIDECERIININRRGIRRLKRVRFQLWKPRIDVEWEFPFRD